jgi:hypothetical protein
MSGNSLLTISMITRESLRLFKNTNSFIQHIDKQYDDSYAVVGAKIGSALRIRLPNDYTVRTGQAAQPQDTNEQSTTLTLATQKGVDLAFTSADRTLSLDDFSRRILAPAINVLVGNIAADVMNGALAGVANFVINPDNAGNPQSPVAGTWLSAGALLDVRSGPVAGRNAVLNPFSMAKTVTSLTGLLNPAPRISQQYEDAEMKDGLGLMWYKDQTVLTATGGSFSSGTVNGAGQSGLNLVINTTTGNLVIGDIVNFAGVNLVNRVTKVDTGILAQFVVTAPVTGGATTALSVYPALIGPLTLPNGLTTPVQYQTVTASPANGAAISLVNPASTSYRKNLVYVPEAVILATADLELPEGVANAAREKYDDLSMRMISAYDIRDDVFFTRLDILYGYLWIRPEWIVAVADNTSFT